MKLKHGFLLTLSLLLLMGCQENQQSKSETNHPITSENNLSKLNKVKNTEPSLNEAKTESLEKIKSEYPMMTVYKSSSCGCCVGWINHMKAEGFDVTVVDYDEKLSEFKQLEGVPEDKYSCHTAKIGGYFVEGHIPADDVKKLLKEKPSIKGIVVPGMPLGTPGMEVGDIKESFTTYAVAKDGKVTTFATHKGNKDEL